jgi:putative endonuclease
MRVKDAVGRYGEQLAAEHLVSSGMAILDRNWRCADGELDLVARDGDDLVFVEVKTRSTTAFGDPAEAVSPAKASRVRRLALRWLAAHGRDTGAAPRHVRFDVVTVVRLGHEGPQVSHLRAAF